MKEETYTSDQLDDLETHLENWLIAYEIGEPEIDDEQYDYYKELLRKFRPKSIFLTKIGNKPKRNKEKLPYILGSLTNYFEENIRPWLLKHDNGYGFVLSHKLDGVAIELEYTEGELTKAWLRGDHYEGENITHKALRFIKNKINNNNNNKLYFKGEVLLNCEPDTIGYKTKRNAVAGILNRDDLSKLKYLYFKVHNFISNDKFDEIERLLFAQQAFGQENVISFILKYNPESVLETARKMIQDETQYDKDGIVITVNLSEVENVKYPENKIALKFNKMTTETEVEEVEWETSRTGKIIPVVKFKPIILGGATIQKATGFHSKFIYDNNIGPGAIITVIRSGDVTPYIKVIKKSDNEVIKINNCPSCGNTDLTTDGTHTYCTSPKCSVQTQKRIAYFLEKVGLENYGEKMISTLNCNSILDIYNLKKEDIIKINGWAETSAADFIKRINETKKAKPEKVLAALGINNLGTTTAKLIINQFPLQVIINAFNDRLLLNEIIYKLIQTKGIGDKKIVSIIKGIKENIKLLEKFIELSNTEVKKDDNNLLIDKKFCITGTLSKPRKVYEQIIEKFGGENTSITSCNYLICNDHSSSKFKKAIERGIKIIKEQEFIDMLKSLKKK